MGSPRSTASGKPAGRAVAALAVVIACAGLVAYGWPAPPPTNPTPTATAAPARPVPPVSPDPADPAAELDRQFTQSIQPLLAIYCAECHGGQKAKADIRLDSINSLRDALRLADDLALAKEMVAIGEMPPFDKPQPTDDEKQRLMDWIDAALKLAPADEPIDPGWFTIHRLNRAEYRNTLRDLLGIDPTKVDIAAKLPRDDTGYGFDNIADVLTMSPLAVEEYLSAAEQGIELALGPEVHPNSQMQLAIVPPLEESDHGSQLPQGGFHIYAAGSVGGAFESPLSAEYIIRLSAWEDHGGDEHANLSLRIDKKERKSFAISGTRAKPQEIEYRTRLKPGMHLISAFFTNDFYQAKVADRNLAVEWISITGPIEGTIKRPAVWREIFEVSHAQDESKTDDQRAAAIIEPFAARAYRRPLLTDELAGLIDLFRAQRAERATFERAVRTVLTAVLVSPNFLYRSLDNPDAGDPAAIYHLNTFELASRLSYFLWSCSPDEALLELAQDGSLSDDAVLGKQVQRMLRDDRAQSFIDNFAGQWLQLRSLDALAMDRGRFPEYDDDLRAAMISEAKLLFADVVRGDQSLLTFLDSNYTFLNEKLARFYGIEGVKGEKFRRVELPEASPRGGVLTMGAVLTVTSNTTRTSPVKRGLYVLDQILGTPPPPPPPEIPPLEQAAAQNPEATLREQLAAHVGNPSCAVCHVRLDPLGLAFENFDAIGRWRDEDQGRPIDAAGTLPGGQTFTGPGDLKKILLDQGDQFIQTLSGKVLMYAIGRGIEPFDRPAVRRIAAHTRGNHDRFSAMIQAIVTSPTFKTCRGREPNTQDQRQGAIASPKAQP